MNIDTAILDEFSRFVSKSAELNLGAASAAPQATIDSSDPISGQPEQRINQTAALNKAQQPSTITANSSKAPTSGAPYKKIKF